MSTKLIKYKEEYKSRFPTSPISIIGEAVNKNYILVNTEYGICKIRKQHLLNGSLPSIESALDKNQYFINRANKIHNFKYQYPFLNYTTAHNKIIITCPEHGNFSQSANDHINKKGCSKCGDNRCSKHHANNPSGWTKDNWERNSTTSKQFDIFKVYIIKCWNDEEIFYKIGRTFRKVESRFSGKSSLPYEFSIIKIIEGNSEDIYNLETKLKSLNKNSKYTPKIPFKGDKECFSIVNLVYSRKEIEEFLSSHKDVESFSWILLTKTEEALSIIK